MLRRLFIATAALGVSFYAAELVLPLVPPHFGTMQRIVHHVDNSRKYALKPGIEIPFTGMFETLSPAVTWEVNEQGLRAKAPVPPLSDRFRIASFGDSETFGWSVSLEDTFQKRMEQLDARIEVLNFGIPGYNAENVADYIEDEVPEYSPDFLVYFVNKNDSDLANDISDPVLASEVLLRVRFFYQALVLSRRRHELRHSPERMRFLADQIDRIARYSEEHRVPVLFAFMRQQMLDEARAVAAPEGFIASTAPGARGDQQLIVVDDLLRRYRRYDDHYAADAYRSLAARLCDEIAAGSGGCMRPRWTASQRAPRTELAQARTRQ
jgi:hypothetical protein